MLSKIWVLLLLAPLCVVPKAIANENTFICNETDQTIKFVNVSYFGFDEFYSAEGWRSAAPGQCTNTGISYNWRAPSWFAFTDENSTPLKFTPTGDNVLYDHPKKVESICYTANEKAWKALETKSLVFGYEVFHYYKPQKSSCSDPGFVEFPVSFGIINKGTQLKITLN